MAKHTPKTLPARMDLLSRKEREQGPNGRPRKRQLHRDSVIPLTEGGPKRLRCGPGEANTLAAGIKILQELAKDEPVYLVRRADPSRVQQGKSELGYLLCRMAWDRITEQHLVPGVTLYAARTKDKDGPVLVIVDPVALDWRRTGKEAKCSGD